MRLHRLSAIRRDSGFAWIADLPEELIEGDRPGQSTSRLTLFEDSRELGPCHASHDDIRTIGSGAFSHWGSQLYFSTSDNSTPTSGSRSYYVVAPEIGEDRHHSGQAHLVASHPESFRACLQASMSTMGAELHSILSLRMLLAAMRDAGFDPAGKRLLEIGASPSNGLAIALALPGAGTVVANNIVPVPTRVRRAFAENVAVLTALVAPLRRRLDDVMSPADADGFATLSPSIVETVSPLDAAALPELHPADLVFSFSVLEHIRHLPEVLERTRLATAPDGLAIHWIDLRDHTDFTDPLKCLRLSEDEFQARYTTDHNRWRRAEYMAMFQEAGWDVVSERVAGRTPTLANKNTDMFALAMDCGDSLFVADASDLPEITRAERSALRPPYRDLPSSELAVLGLRVTARPQPPFPRP